MNAATTMPAPLFASCATEHELLCRLTTMTAKNTSNILGLLAVAAGACVVKSLVSRSFGYDFKDKVVLITGGSRGLGLVMAREFAREGARLAICARDEDELNRGRLDLESRGAEVMTHKCDVTSRSDVTELLAAVHDRF